MQQYLDALDLVMSRGRRRENRTGVDTIGVFGHQMRFDLQQGFPLLTTKKMFTRGIIEELLWFLRGSTNARELSDVGVHIWDQWADPKTGELGPVYGAQWRNWYYHDIDEPLGFDQIATVLRDIKLNPDSRRMIVSGWNVPDVARQALPPCHTMFQFYVSDGQLSCQLYQRSADLFLGVPFNIASYALLTHIIAEEAGLEVGEFVHTFGDLHIYTNHLDQVREQLSRTPRPAPTLVMPRGRRAPVDVALIKQDFEGFDYTSRERHLTVVNGQVVALKAPPVDPDHDVLPRYHASEFSFEGYDPHPAIKAEVAV